MCCWPNPSQVLGVDPQIRSQRRRGTQGAAEKKGSRMGRSRGRRAGHLLARSLSASTLLLRPPDQGETSHQNSSTSLLRVVAYCDRACHPRTDRDTASLPGACFVHSIRYPTTTCCDFSRRRARPRALLSAIANDVSCASTSVPLGEIWNSTHGGRRHLCIPECGTHSQRAGRLLRPALSQNGIRMQTRRTRQQLPDSARIPVARGLAAPRPFPAAPSP